MINKNEILKIVKDAKDNIHICPKCRSDNNYRVSRVVGEEYPFNYTCKVCGYAVLIDSEEEESKILVKIDLK